ncbi:MAG: hypothetical protein GY757_19835, partial [bacterium]|nr:hypothetical protein [bacterium]
MKKYITLAMIMALCGILSFLTAGNTNPLVTSTPTFKSPVDFGKIPLYFIQNKGQLTNKVKFYCDTGSYTLLLTKNNLLWGRRSLPKHPFSRFSFIGANQSPEMVPLDITRHKVNIYKGKKPPLTGLSSWKAVLYKNLYKNIDLKVYGTERKIEYDWVLNPGGDPADICFRFENVKTASLSPSGCLEVTTPHGNFIHNKPVSYQLIAGKRVAVETVFKSIGSNAFGLDVKEYDKNHPLIIDPVVLAFSTYLGGNGNDSAGDVVYDDDGNLYIAGVTKSTDFPITGTESLNGDSDAFISKISADGSEIVYSTYFGGSGDDQAWDIALTDGNAYVTGYTGSTDFPVSAYAYQEKPGGGLDVFLAGFNTNGQLLYSTYFGGSADDFGSALEIYDGRLCITGRTESTDFPIAGASFQSQYGGNGDAFLIAFHGTSFQHSSYLGGAESDTGYGIVLKESGLWRYHYYIVGYTGSTDFPITPDAF